MTLLDKWKQVKRFMSGPFQAAGNALTNVLQALMQDLYARVATVEQQQRKLREDMTAEQDKLDTAVAAINEAVSNVNTEIDALKAGQAAGTPLDFAGLDAAVASLNKSTDAVESTETPAETPPVDPNAPIDQPPVEPVA